MPPISQQLDSPWPHRMAVVLVCATFPLIWVGGLVTTHEAGMAVPDWPSTYGYNLFLYPWQTWIAGPWDLFIEHGHRLLGAFVGMLTIALLAAVVLRDSRRWMRYVAVGALLAVIAQGALGGARVLLDERQLAMIHGCFGPAFFAFTAAIAVFTSDTWKRPSQVHEHARGVQVLACLTTVLAYLQLIFGAHLRHLSVMAGPNAFRAAVFFHLIGAVVLAYHVIWLAWRIHGERITQGTIRRPAQLLVGILAAQIVLGANTWVAKWGWPTWFANFAFAERHTVQEMSFVQSLVTTAHVATGSLILATATTLAVRSLRVLRPQMVSLRSAQDKLFTGLVA